MPHYAIQHRTTTAASVRQAIALRSPMEIRWIREAGCVVRAALEAAASIARPGVSTLDLDYAARCILAESSAEPLLLHHPGGYPVGDPSLPIPSPFPAATCVSVNDEVLHGIPSSDRILSDGDIVSIDCAASINGWCADAAVTIQVGQISTRLRHLCSSADLIMTEALACIQPGRAWSTVAAAMADLARSLDVFLLSGFAGHGIGRRLHEPPSAPCVTDCSFKQWSDFVLRPGMVLAIEPIVTLHAVETIVKPDGWTVSTLDGSPSVHIEHTVAVTRNGAEVLTDGH